MLIIPKKAIITEENLEKVYMVNKDKRIKIIPVKTESNEEMVLIKDGLVEGDIVVINSNYKLEDGDEVRITK